MKRVTNKQKRKLFRELKIVTNKQKRKVSRNRIKSGILTNKQLRRFGLTNKQLHKTVSKAKPKSYPKTKKR